MADTEHILLESEDRTVPSRRAARKIHAQCVLRSRLRNRTLQLEIIDFYYLSVKLLRARSPVSEYVLDLRFVDPALHFSRHIAWRWIGASLIIAVLTCASVSQISSPPFRWRHDWLLVCAGLLGLTAFALFVCIYRTTETLALRSAHGRARLLEFTGQLGMSKGLRPFMTKLGAHIRIAVEARRSSKPQHLRDEMREHFRLRELGVLPNADYEASKTRILSEHAAK
jgi:hypothetical protein